LFRTALAHKLSGNLGFSVGTMIPAWGRLALCFTPAVVPAALADEGTGISPGASGAAGPWGGDLLFNAGLAGLLIVVVLLAVLLVVVYRRFVSERGERRRLAADRRRLGEILAASPDGYVCWDLVDGRGTVSPRLAAMVGLEDAADWSFDAIHRRLDKDSAAALDDALAALRNNATGFDLLITLGGAEGEAASSFRVIGVRAKSADGQPVGDLLWFRDLSSFVARTTRLVAENEALEAERNRLQMLLDAVPIPVWLRRSDLSLSFCNKAYGTAVEADPAAALHEDRQIAGSVIANRGKDLAERARRTEVTQCESHHIVVGGDRRLFEFAECPLEGEGIEAGEVAGYAMDFTDLEKVQTELSRQIAAHENVLENLSTAVAVYGAERKLRFFNTAYKMLWRLDEDWLRRGPEIGDVLEAQRERRRLPEHADFRAFKQARIRLFTSLIEPQEELLHLPDETTLRMTVAPHPFGGLVFTFDDVTDKLALERSYNTLIAVQRETLDHLHEGAAVFGRDGRLKLFNPAYAKVWNVSPEWLADEPRIAEVMDAYRGFYGIEDDGEWAEAKEKMIAELIETTLRSGQFERNDGSVLEYAAVPLPDGNVLLRYVDVTDRFRVEQALRDRNEALETASRLKSEFIANVSYELRTPLNTIIGFSEILKEQYFGTLNERQKEYSEGILEASHLLLSLINDILDLATIEAGYMELELETVDVHAMLVSVLSLTRERARGLDLDLEFDCPSGIGTLHADSRRVKQAVFNLISNSIKFTPVGGEITLSARREGEEMAISVADTGIGVPAEDQERVFEKFVQGPASRSGHSGAGLGLSLVKSLIELHGGRVVLESARGKGTRVTCFLPLRASEVGAAPAARRA
jgi:signal transduction histidine kinase